MDRNTYIQAQPQTKTPLARTRCIHTIMSLTLRHSAIINKSMSTYIKLGLITI